MADNTIPNPALLIKQKINLEEHSVKQWVEANLRLVFSVANEYTHRGIPFSALFEAGKQGLIEAIEQFGDCQGDLFLTNVMGCIRQAIVDHIPPKTAPEIRQTRPAEKQIKHLSGEKIQALIQITKEPISLETPIGENEKNLLGNFIPDSSILSPFDVTVATELQEGIQRVLSKLKPREAEILRMRFGLDMRGEHSLEEIGKLYGVSRDRIRQIEAKALRKLRQRCIDF